MWDSVQAYQKYLKNRTGVLLLVFGLILTGLMHAKENVSPHNINLITKESGIQIELFKSFDDVYDPSIQLFYPSKENTTGRAVLICPGGGYGMVVGGYEGADWANYFNGLGIVTIVLKYRLPKGNYKIPLADAEAALSMIKDSAGVWNINPDDVGIMGFSAGGHLASTIATHTEASLKPAFQLLFYPVITMDKSFTHKGSRDNFLGKAADKQLENLYSNEKQVTKDTPPAFVVLAADDQIVLPDNGINYFKALVENKVYATMHIYPAGGHGWDFSQGFKYKEEVLTELTSWLNDIK
ncbi:MAG: alpha/beta hydrolase [Paludibacter sp.]|nr:alpha/beta hydrolase [Paludibacter sp.]